jgi:hypothetical protein
VKTTVELPDSLLREAKAVARARRVTLRQLIADGLRTQIEREQRRKEPFRLRDGSAHLGKMLVESWPEIRRIIYEGRGE